MGVLPKNRKQKFNKSGTPNPNKSNNSNDAEIIHDVSKAKTKKTKKNKISVMFVESKNVNDASDVKVKKNKIVEMTSEEVNVVKAKLMKIKFVEMSNETKSESDLGKPKAKKSKINKVKEPSNEVENEDNTTAANKVKKTDMAIGASGDVVQKGLTDEMLARYPILKDQEMIKKIQTVTLTNNKKGCLRSQLRQQLRGTSDALLPDAINTRIQAILKTENPNFMKIRVLFNMLKTALLGTKTPVKREKRPVKKDEKQKQKKEENGPEDGSGTEEKKSEQKVKGPKRYVVFIGNLALDIIKEKILDHFSDLSDKIKDVRIPKPLKNKKSAIAYLEVADELSYELALSKHHSMLDNRRINVLYSTQKNSKISKAEAKGKAAKLVAMQKSGQLAGSAPLSKKRSARRKKMKLAQKNAQEAAERGV